LNEATKNKIENLTLLSLTDTGNFITERVANFFEGLGDALSGIWDYLVENVLEQLYNILDLFLDALGLIDLVLGWIPIVGQAIMLIEATIVTMKTLAGLALVLAGKMQLNQFLLATAIDLAGVIPGVPRFAVKAVAKTATKATGILIRAGSRAADIAIDTAEVASNFMLTAGFRGVHLGVKGLARFSTSRLVVRRVNASWRNRIRQLDVDLDKAWRSKSTREKIREMLEVHNKVGDNIYARGRAIGDDMITNSDEFADFLSDQIPDEAYEEILRKLEEQVEEQVEEQERALSNFSTPSRFNRYPVLVPCRLALDMAVAA